DWYSVGAVLYEALTGKLPFPGDSVEVLVNKQWFDPPSPQQLDPSLPDDLNALCCALLSRDPAARPTGREVLKIIGGTIEAPPRTPVWLRSHRDAPFVGREPALAVLEEAFERVIQGMPAIVLVSGRSGIGKTALVRRFLEQRPAETVVLTGRCYQQESVPFKAIDPLIDSLSEHLDALSRTERHTLLPFDLPALARLFPVLQKLDTGSRPGREALDIPDRHEVRRRGFSGLRELLGRLARRSPCILFIDDVQWGDLDSASLLGELMRPSAPPLLLIAAFRSEEEEMSPLLKRLRPTLSLLGNVTEIALEELMPAEAHEMSRLLLEQSGRLPSSLAGAIARESGGSPFFIDELVSYREFAGEDARTAPTPLEGMIRARIQRLPLEARVLLEIVAVAGKPIEESVARRASAARSEELRTLALLRAAHLIRSQRRGERNEIEVDHDRIRETLLAQLSADDLKARHYALAEALEAEAGADPETLSVHFREAGDCFRASRYATMAAEQASKTLAFDRAARLFSRALELAPAGSKESHRLRIQLADALTSAGRGKEAADTYLQAAEQAPFPETLELTRRAAEQLLRSGHIDEGITALRRVLAPLGYALPTTPSRALVSLLWGRARIKLRGLAFQERTEPSDPRADTERHLRIDTCWSVAVGLGIVDNIRGSAFQARHLLLALNEGEPYRIIRALSLEAGYSAMKGVGSATRTRELLQTARALADRVDHPHAHGLVTLVAGMSAGLEGRWKAAQPLTEQAEKLLREGCTGVAWELFNAQYFSLLGLFYLGQMRELGLRLPILLKEAEERGDLYAATSLSTRIAYSIRLSEDSPDEARRALDGAMERWSHKGFHMQHVWQLFGRVEIALYEGQAADAWRQISSEWRLLNRSLLTRIQLVRIGALQRRARCAIAAAAEQPRGSSGQSTLLQEAHRTLGKIESEDAPWSRPLALLLSAGIAAARGRTEEALLPLRAAEAAADAGDLALYRAVTRLRLGRLVGGDEGRSLVQSAEGWMREQDVRNPDRIVAMLAPGF
ncbi:MAG: AAA family ATPase, partial [Thermoanaerobaculia bacterium]